MRTAPKKFLYSEVVINAPMEAVYAAIADADKMVEWFPDEIEGLFAVGEQPVFVFKGHGKYTVVVVDAKPYDYFAFRWVPGATGHLCDLTNVTTTLVEFRLEERDGVTTVTLTESGLASQPAETGEAAFKQNSGGWEFMLARLVKQFPKE